MKSSIDQLSERFEWARTQALAYAHDGSDPVGLWYEAGLPGREAFCMRDVSHQALGAHFLGLDEHTRNMLFRFAKNITEGKDWCSYWEINRKDEPAAVDYRDDKAFWYNLPANFDVLDASYRMYQWTGDLAYVDHPVFLEFYERTISDYVERWDLGTDTILERKRYMNRESFDSDDYYQYARGIPSYHEGNQGSTGLGVDLLAFQLAAYRSYAGIMTSRGETARASDMLTRAVRVSELIEDVFWNETDATFDDLHLTSGENANGGGMRIYTLYNDAIPNRDIARLAAASLLQFDPGNIEMRSHLPEVLYRYGRHAEALDMLMLVSDKNTPRREYPEVSFAVIGALATGLMGIAPLEHDLGVSTISRISTEEDFVELNGFEHHERLMSLRHDGTSSTTLTLHGSKNLLWRAAFQGKHQELWVRGRSIRTTIEQDLAGDYFSYADIQIYPQESITVSVHQ